MTTFARKLWDKQNSHPGDRERLFGAVAEAVPDAATVLYAGSYVDVAPSFVFDDVTYVDLDKRAAKFFDDADEVASIIAEHRTDDVVPRFRFIHSDYSDPLDIADDSVGLLVSLYAGFISESCTRYLRVGGTLLVNPSHGDAAMAAIDDRYVLSGAVISRSGSYRIATDRLDVYLEPKRPQEITREFLHEWGRGIAYTKPAFAYLFTRIA